MDIVVFAILKKLIKAVASGVKNVTVGSDNMSLDFELNTGTVLNIKLPNPLTPTAIDICNKLTADVNGIIYYDGNPINFTPNQMTLLNKFSLDSKNDLYYDGTPIAMLTQAEKDAIQDLTTEITFNKDANGDVTNINIGGTVFENIVDSSTGDITGVKINGEKVVTQADQGIDTDITDTMDSLGWE